MSCFELTDSVEGPLNGEPVAVIRDSLTGGVTALWIPTAELFSRPIPLRHVYSTALIHSSGRIWVASIVNHAWTETLLSKLEEFLSRHFGLLPWQYLQTGASEAIEHEVVLHRTCQLDEQFSLLQLPRLADALLRRWMSVQPNLPEVAEIRRMKETLIQQIHISTDRAIADFMSHVDLEIASVCGEAGLRLDMYNYLANPAHRRARLQYAKAFPLLADLVCTADTKSLWREVGKKVDGLHSPVIFLSKELGISTGTVRALNGVSVADVGQYFYEHPKELLSLLNAFPKEFLPKFPEHWQILQQQYGVAKIFFGRSPAAAVLVKARVAHSLRFAVQFNHAEAQLNEEDLPRVERLRSGLVQATYSYYGIERNHPLGIERRARINQMIDRFLGQLSWSRLLESSRKFEKSYAEAIEKNLDAIKFISGQKYFDFCPQGKFVTSTGWFVRCLSSAAELKTHGLQLGVCLATPGHRAVYHEECFLAKAVIFAIHNQLGEAKSTAEFHLSMVKATTKDSMVRFQLVQHTGHKNQAVDSAAKGALESLQGQFATTAWQIHARNGIRFSQLRNTFSSQDAGISAAHFMTSLLALRATFKEKADKLLQQFSGETELQSLDHQDGN